MMLACGLCSLKLFALISLLGPAGAYAGSWVICKYHNRKARHGKKETRCGCCSNDAL